MALAKVRAFSRLLCLLRLCRLTLNRRSALLFNLGNRILDRFARAPPVVITVPITLVSESFQNGRKLIFFKVEGELHALSLPPEP